MTYQKAFNIVFKTICLLTALLMFLGFSSINASAQIENDTTTAYQPFCKQVQKRFDYLIRVQKVNVSIGSIAFETGLSEIQVGDIFFGKSEIVDDSLLDVFCEALLCDFEITYYKRHRRVQLIPKERFEVYSKMSGEVVYEGRF